MTSVASTQIAQAPSNIALIKYMGKSDSALNLPANSSLSMTLKNLCSFAEVRRTPGARASRWTPELPCVEARSVQRHEPRVPSLSAKGIDRVLRHVERVREAAAFILPSHSIPMDGRGLLEVRTANTFPAAAGIASSASSFAALTLATVAACAEDAEVFRTVWGRDVELRRELARVSRQGSGSSCRSFEGPWVLWEGDSAASIRSQMPELADLVVLIGSTPKEISSSEAHETVQTSPLWEGRVDRANARIQSLTSAITHASLKDIARIAWVEAWEMHSLFHTAAEPFTYWEPGSLEVLKWLMPLVKGENPPIVTMDAGANVHVIVPSVLAETWVERIRNAFPRFEILSDEQGTGAELL